MLQLHFRQRRYGGIPDKEKVAILEVLLKKYQS